MAKLKLPTVLGWRFGLVVLLLAVFSLLLGTQNAIDVNENTRCLALYGKRQAEVSEIRSAATQEKDAALARVMDPLVSVILDVTAAGGGRQPSKEELQALRKGARGYSQEQRELALKRAQNPLPKFPERCSEVNR